MTPETGPCRATQGLQNPALADPSKGPPQCGNLQENFRQNAEIVGNCVSHILDVKHCKTRGAENVGNVGNLAANFLRTPEVQSALQTPLCTALSSFQFCSFGFACLVAHCHTSQSFEPSISLPNSHGASAYNQAMENNIAANFCKNPFAKYPFFQLLIFYFGWILGGWTSSSVKSLRLMPLFLMGCFPTGFQEVKRPLGMRSEKRPTKVGKRPTNEGKRPIKAMVLVAFQLAAKWAIFEHPRHGGKRPL